MEHLLQHIRNFHPLTPQAEAAIQSYFVKEVLPKGHQLVEQGKVSRHLFFVEKGAVRGYYNLEGKEITHWFAFESDFVTSFHSFITQLPAVENIQLMEGSVLWSISKTDLSELMSRFHEIERVVRITYENYYIRLEERFVNAQFKTATERYHELMEDRPHIIQRAPLGAIASYLGISQETLSRIRSKV